MTNTEKVAYIRGLIEGLELGTDKKEAKAINAIIDLLDDIALTLADIEVDHEELTDQLGAVDEDLGTLEDGFYGDEDDDEDYDAGDDDCYYGVTCPACNEMLRLTEDIINEGCIDCPNCGENLEFDLESLADEDEEGCSYGCEHHRYSMGNSCFLEKPVPRAPVFSRKSGQSALTARFPKRFTSDPVKSRRRAEPKDGKGDFMKLMKRIVGLVLSAVLLAAPAGCIGQPVASSSAAEAPQSSAVFVAEKTQMCVDVLKGPTGLGVPQVMENNDQKTVVNEYTSTVAGSPDEVAAKLVSGGLGAAAVPTNLTATLYDKTKGGVQLATTNTLGILYLVTSDESIKSIMDPKGKTVYSSGQGAVPEYALNYILTANGLKDDVEVECLTERSEVVSQLLAGKIATAVLPEPFVTQVTTRDAKLKSALDLTDEWECAIQKADQGPSVPTVGVLVVCSEFVKQSQGAFGSFLSKHQQSVNYVNQNPQPVSTLSEKYDIMSAVVIQKAIPNCNIVFIAGDDIWVKMEDFLEVFYEYNSRSTGGAFLKDDLCYLNTAG